uniref:hydroxymethylpyrimidine kinase n=1 Tax=Fundidesulfovibrio putealis TaxID=270496 RepID=A0A7C3W8I7_9BACT
MIPRACVLTIAGSDSGGGAGVQADLKTFMAHGCYGASVITALTAQNTRGVTGIHAPDPEFVALQLRTVLEDIPVRAAKTGMLFSSAIIAAVAGVLSGTDFPLVVDPVCVAQSGHPLLREDAVEALRQHMLPLARLLTPNRPEAELLAGMPITDRESLFAAMERLLAMGPRAVLLKGGHMEQQGGRLTDWLGLPGREPLALPVEYVDTRNTHGTGCCLSAAICARLGRGEPLEDAVRGAQGFLNRALAAEFSVGAGASPPNHLADQPHSC